MKTPRSELRARPGAAAFAAATLMSAVLATPAVADWSDFVPHPWEKHAWIDTFVSWENDDTNAGASKINWNDTFLRERLTVQSQGYVYDPRFLLYKMTLGGAAKQENYERSISGSNGWDFGGAFEYDARLEFLPDHPYNVQVFAMRHEPVYRQQSSNPRNSVADDYGIRARYRRKPWFLDAGFTDSKVDSAGTDSDVMQLSVQGEWFKRFTQGYELSVNGSAIPSWYSDSTGLDGSSAQYSGGHLVNLKKARLSGNISQNTFDQHRELVSSYDTDQFTAWEVLSLYLPWKFRTDFTYRHNDDTSNVANLVPPQENRFSNKGDSEQLDVYHRLYESLDTRYRFLHDLRDSSSGKTELMLNGASLDYTKAIPFGRVISGVSFTRSEIDNSGFADVVNDPYTSTAVPGTFALNQQNVNPASLVVTLRSPLPPFDFIPLIQGLHYLVNSSLEPFEIQILSLPPEFVVPGSYDFFVNYSLETGDYELRNDTTGANLTVETFGDIVAPYVRFLAQRSDVMSGTYPGVPVDSNNYIAGLRLVYGPMRARGEYQDLDWEANPYRAWRAELQYVGAVTRTISAYATATYLNRHFLGAQPPYTTTDYTEESVTIAGSVTKQFYPYNLYVSVGGSWSRISGLSDSDAWSANSSLVWHIGKLDISLQANAYGSTSESPSNPDYEREHQYISINLRRQLL